MVILADADHAPIANGTLHITIHTTIRSFYKHCLISGNPADLWLAVRGCKGHNNHVIPAILSQDGLTNNPPDMANAFHNQFKLANLPNVDIVQPDNPPPLLQHTLLPITKPEVTTTLKIISNASAPGPSGIGYKLLKWAFEASPDHFVSLFDTCLTIGHYPWHKGTVVVLPKPGKLDYSQPKAYQPITLLKCCGKLLERSLPYRSSITTWNTASFPSPSSALKIIAA